jgi:predicted DNA-binding protein (MmcQ/YjbR family)
MVSATAVREAALVLPESEEKAPFENPSFCIRKKIFATMRLKEKRVVLKLSLIDQSVFTSFDHTIFYPVSGIWGKQGWTIVELAKVKKSMFTDALTCAFRQVAPDSLTKKYRLKQPIDED